MKKLLLLFVLIALAVSGCMEKGPSIKEQSAEEIKDLAVNSSENISTYRLTGFANQTLKLKAAVSNATQGETTTILERIKTVTSVNLTDMKAEAVASTEEVIELPGKAANVSSSQATAYLIGNYTYIDENGKWTHLKDTREANEIWGNGNNSQVSLLAKKIQQSQVEIVGSEVIDGEDTYKLKIQAGSGDYNNLYSAALGIAAKLAKYPLFIAAIDSTEVNRTSQMSMLVWISKDTYLPKKYQSNVSFNMTPMIVGSTDPKTGQIMQFNQSVLLGEVSVDLETTNLYYDFDKPIEISLPSYPPTEVTSSPP
jgi:hypothetical protein